MFNGRDITEEQLYFAIYCVTALSRNTNKTPDEVYDLLANKTNIMDDYIIKYYDTLHTQGEDYIVSEIMDLLKEKEISV